MKIKTLSYKKLKERFDNHESNGEVTFKIPFSIVGETGATFRMVATLKGPKPPQDVEGAEDLFIVGYSSIDGRGSQKYHAACYRELKNRLYNYRCSMPEIDLKKKNYIGVQTKGWDEKNPIKPVFLELNQIEQDPIIIETSSELKRYFFEIEGRYYLAEGDPIKDVVSGEMLKRKEKLLNMLKESMPITGHNSIQKVQKEIPVYQHKGIPVYYFSRVLYFNDHYREGMNIVLGEREERFGHFTKKDNGYKTFEQFRYANSDKFPNIDSLLKINKEALRGKKLKTFNPREEIVVTHPSEEHEALKGVIGVVEGKVRDLVKVRFLNYFTEVFETTEIQYVKEKEAI